MDHLFLAPQRQSIVPAREGFVLSRETDDIAPRHPVSEYFAFLQRWKWLLIAFCFIGCACGYAVAQLQTPQYEAKSTLEIENLNDTFLNAKQFLPVSEGDNSTNLYSEIQTQLKVLESDRVTGPAVERLLARGPQTYPVTSPNNWLHRKLFGEPPSPEAALRADLVRMAREFKVRAIGQTRIVELTARSSNRKLAADFLDEISDEFIRQNRDWLREMGVRTTESLGKLLQDDRRRVRESEDALEDYAKKAGLLYVSGDDNVAQEKLKKLQDELASVEAARMAAQAKYESARSVEPEALPDELTTSVLRDQKQQLTELNKQLAQYTSSYTPEYPKIKKLASQIAMIQDAIKHEGADIVKKAQATYRQALQNEKLLAAEYDAQSHIVADMDQRTVQYDILKQEVDASRKGYEDMLKSVKEASVAATLHPDGARVIDRALAPPDPDWPRPALNALLGSVGVLALGLVFAGVREGTDRRIREPRVDFGSLPVRQLGVVPHAKRRELRVPPIGGVAEFSTLAESYRAVVTSLTSAPHRNRPKTLIVTSASAQDGKTTVTANLACILAAIGHTVLVVDADLRRGRLHEIFGVDNSTGFSDLLSREAPPMQFIKSTTASRLNVLPAGPVSSVSPLLLHTPMLGSMLSILKSDYDFVLVDTPPMVVSDARVIAQHADAAIVVARCGKTSKDGLSDVLRRFASEGVHVQGLIFNDWKPGASRLREYEYYRPRA